MGVFLLPTLTLRQPGRLKNHICAIGLSLPE